MIDVHDAILEAAKEGFLPPSTNGTVDTQNKQAEGEPTPWESPIAFDSVDVPPFPTDALPQVQRLFVEASALALQVPTDLTGNLAIGVASATAARYCYVRLNREWVEPLNAYVCCVLPSGERKSVAFRQVTSPLSELERELATRMAPEVEKSKAERDVLEKRLQVRKTEAAKANDTLERESLMMDVADLAKQLAEFQSVNTPRLLADDATAEAVTSLLSEQGGRIAVMSTEGFSFEGIIGLGRLCITFG